MSETLNRSKILKAADAVCTDRNDIYGYASTSFREVADMWKMILSCPVTAEQVALCMIALKIVRATYKPTHADSWIDIAGYAALGGEIAGAQEE